MIEQLRGYRIADPYRWLEDSTDAAVCAWAAEQDQWYARHRSEWADRAAWAHHLDPFVTVGRISTPLWRGRRCFTEYHGPGETPTLLCREEPGAPTRVLPLPAAVAAPSTQLVAWRPSWEGDRIACQFSRGGSDLTELWVLDVGDGRVLDGPITGTQQSPIAWLPGGELFCYVRTAPDQPGPGLHLRVLLHRVGTDAANDALVFGTADPHACYGLAAERSGRRLAVSLSWGVAPRNDVWLAEIDGDQPQAWRWSLLVDGAQRQALSAPRFAPSGRLHLLTNHHAPRGRILVTDGSEADGWQELIGEDAAGLLDDCAWLSGPPLDRAQLLVLRAQGATSRLSVHDAETGAHLADVALPGPGTVTGLRTRPEGGHQAWLTYTDSATPHTVYRYDAITNTLTVWPEPGEAEQPAARACPALSCAVGAPSTLRTRQVTYPAADGTAIDLFLLDPPVIPAGPRPVLLTGYGGFGIPSRPVYSPLSRAWVAAGGTVAIACVRGGGEHGSAWHDAGRRANKTTAVDDFNAAATWLIHTGVTTPEHLAATGASHGGLLVLAAVVRCPELYAAVVADGPLADMVRYERFGIGRIWTEEFGSATDPEQLGWLLSYSPYHQVRAEVAYPAVLLTGPVTDERTGEAHVRKMCAVLQHATGPGNPVLMRREPDSGHGRASPDKDAALLVDTLTFLAAHTGLPLQLEIDPSAVVHRTE